MKITDAQFRAAKAAVLAGESIRSQALKFGEDVGNLGRALRKDPEIAHAREQGLLPERIPKKTPEEWAAKPGVARVLAGESCLSVAKELGLKQPKLWSDVQRAKGLQGRKPRRVEKGEPTFADLYAPPHEAVRPLSK